MQEFAKANGIPLYIQCPEIVDGWVGKPKGLLQVLRWAWIQKIHKNWKKKTPLSHE